MIKRISSETYSTLLTKGERQAWDMDREEIVKIKILGLTVYSRHRKFKADYLDDEKQSLNIGFKK